jgi:hypothetical protein
MSDGALRDTSEDADAAISNQPEVSVPIELAVQPPSEGTDSVVSGVADGTELVEGQVRTEARLSELWTAPATTQLVTSERRRSALHHLWPVCTVRATESRIFKAKCTGVVALGVGNAL